MCAGAPGSSCAAGGFDVIADYAMPIPIAAIGRVLGVDTSDMEQFRAWSEAMQLAFEREPTEATRKACSRPRRSSFSNTSSGWWPNDAPGLATTGSMI